jgi:hypothetical protein
MKHINKFNEAKLRKAYSGNFESWPKWVDPRIKEQKDIEELCVWLKDEVDNVKVEPNGNSYNLEIRFSRDSNSIDKIVENAEKMLEITKEYTDLLFKLEDSGYEISYQLLQTSQHLNFYNLTGKIQFKKAE